MLKESLWLIESSLDSTQLLSSLDLKHSLVHAILIAVLSCLFCLTRAGGVRILLAKLRKSPVPVESRIEEELEELRSACQGLPAALPAACDQTFSDPQDITEVGEFLQRSPADEPDSMTDCRKEWVQELGIGGARTVAGKHQAVAPESSEEAANFFHVSREAVQLMERALDKDGNPLLLPAVRVVNEISSMEELPLVRGSHFHCVQVVFGLLMDVCRFMTSGSVTLRARHVHDSSQLAVDAHVTTLESTVKQELLQLRIAELRFLARCRSEVSMGCTFTVSLPCEEKKCFRLGVGKEAVRLEPRTVSASSLDDLDQSTSCEGTPGSSLSSLEGLFAEKDTKAEMLPMAPPQDEKAELLPVTPLKARAPNRGPPGRPRWKVAGADGQRHFCSRQ